MKAYRTLCAAVVAGAILSGCAATLPYKDALRRFGETGQAVQPHLKPAPDASVQALYDAFDAACKEAVK